MIVVNVIFIFLALLSITISSFKETTPVFTQENGLQLRGGLQFE